MKRATFGNPPAVFSSARTASVCRPVSKRSSFTFATGQGTRPLVAGHRTASFPSNQCQINILHNNLDIASRRCDVEDASVKATRTCHCACENQLCPQVSRRESYSVDPPVEHEENKRDFFFGNLKNLMRRLGTFIATLFKGLSYKITFNNLLWVNFKVFEVMELLQEPFQVAVYALKVFLYKIILFAALLMKLFASKTYQTISWFIRNLATIDLTLINDIRGRVDMRGEGRNDSVDIEVYEELIEVEGQFTQEDEFDIVSTGTRTSTRTLYSHTSPLMREVPEASELQLSNLYIYEDLELYSDDFDFDLEFDDAENEDDELDMKYYEVMATIVIRKLKSRAFVVSPEIVHEHSNQDTICSVCLESWNEKPGDVAIDLDCTHKFHKKCIFKWCAFGNLNCPICRQQFI